MSKVILLVDDEADLVNVVSTRLQAFGYEVLVAGTARQALALLEKTMPDLILLDLLLPEEMQGDTLCRQLKSDPKYKKLPIIIFTASMARIPSRVKWMMADDYVMKPFEAAKLLEMIKKYI